MKTISTHPRIAKFGVFLITLVGLSAAILFTLFGSNQNATAQSTKENHLPAVSVIKSTPQPITVQVTARGQVSAHYETTLVSEISARVTSVAPALASGKYVAAGTPLANMEKSAYVRQLAMAENNLAEAQVTLLEEQRKAQQASSEWQQAKISGTPKSPLLLREPQLKAAQTAVSSAESSVAWAQQQLACTEVKAPFNAVIKSRQIAPGSYLTEGDPIASLYSRDQMEVRVPLSQHQWQRLPAEQQLINHAWPATLTTIDGRQWQGTVIRVERHADADTRQQALVIAVDNNSSDHFLMPGTFVETTLAGKQFQQILELPQSSYTSQGQIWLVDDNNTLVCIDTTPIYRSAEHVYIVPPNDSMVESSPSWRVLIRPLATYLPGMKVAMEEIENHD